MTKLTPIIIVSTISVLSALPGIAGEGAVAESMRLKRGVLNVEGQYPYTHIANIPEDADPSSIKFEGVRRVEVRSRTQSATDAAYCKDLQFRDPGGSMYCPSTKNSSPTAAYQVTYSFRAEPMASDEYGDRHFTFSVYFRPEELSAILRERLAQHSIAKADAAAYFDLTTLDVPVRTVAIDEAKSAFCGGDFVNGTWTHTDASCQDKIDYKTNVAPSGYITVRIDPATVQGVIASR
jgi:hypothetical protein